MMSQDFGDGSRVARVWSRRARSPHAGVLLPGRWLPCSRGWVAPLPWVNAGALLPGRERPGPSGEGHHPPKWSFTASLAASDRFLAVGACTRLPVTGYGHSPPGEAAFCPETVTHSLVGG